MTEEEKEKILKEAEEKSEAVEPTKITPTSNPLKVNIPKPKKKR